MEASGIPAGAVEAAPAAFDVSNVRALLDEAEQAYHAAFAGHVPNEVERFDAFLATLRMVLEQSADMAPKNLATAARNEVLATQPGVTYQQNPAPVPAA